MNIQAMKALMARPIAFNPTLAKIAGGALHGLFLSQCVYWAQRATHPDGWFYKTRQEWTQETAMSRYELESARKALRKIGVLEEGQGHGADKRDRSIYYRVNMARLFMLIEESEGGDAASAGSVAPPAGAADAGETPNPADAPGINQPLQVRETGRCNGGKPADAMAGNQPLHRLESPTSLKGTESTAKITSETTAQNTPTDPAVPPSAPHAPSAPSAPDTASAPAEVTDPVKAEAGEPSPGERLLALYFGLWAARYGRRPAGVPGKFSDQLRELVEINGIHIGEVAATMRAYLREDDPYCRQNAHGAQLFIAKFDSLYAKHIAPKKKPVNANARNYTEDGRRSTAGMAGPPAGDQGGGTGGGGSSASAADEDGRRCPEPGQGWDGHGPAATTAAARFRQQAAQSRERIERTGSGVSGSAGHPFGGRNSATSAAAAGGTAAVGDPEQMSAFDAGMP